MTDGHIQFDAAMLKQAAEDLRRAQDAFLTDTEQLLSQVSDPAVFGTNDTVGSVAAMVYESVIERVRETVDSLKESGNDHYHGLSAAAQAYAQTENKAKNLSQGMIHPWQ